MAGRTGDTASGMLTEPAAPGATAAARGQGLRDNSAVASEQGRRLAVTVL